MLNEEKYLKERVEDQIDWYCSKSITNKNYNYVFKALILFISASIPVLTGVLDTTIVFNKVVIGSMGALITVITGIISIGKFQEKWTNYRTTSETLKHQKYLFVTQADPYVKEDSFKSFVNTIESIISKENSDWNTYITKKESKKKI